MAAGLGRRFGGPKQIQPVGPSGEILLEYSVYDALAAGFGRVVFVVSQQTEAPLRVLMQPRIGGVCPMEFVLQQLLPLPTGVRLPPSRSKPWGTAHAVLSCAGQVESRFAVINADDFYGRGSFLSLGIYLNHVEEQQAVLDIALVGFPLENTLTEHGSVAAWRVRGRWGRKPARGAGTDEDRSDGRMALATWILLTGWTPIPQGSLASMNMWGFMPPFFQHLEEGFREFLAAEDEDLAEREFFLPEFVNRLLLQGKARVKVLPSQESWYGVTYREDLPRARQHIGALIEHGVYPRNLWGV